MENISSVYVTDYIPSIYSKPATIKYIQNGTRKSCDVVLKKNSVVIILFNKTKDVLVLVKQFRPSVYFQEISKHEGLGKIDISKYPAKAAVTLEFCGGLEDKGLPSEKIAQEEILEECGYQVPIESLEKILNICNLPEATGARNQGWQAQVFSKVFSNPARNTYYYCEVTENQRVTEGGGCEDEHENIEVVEMKVKDVVDYASQKYVCSPSNLLFGLNWFLYHKYNKLKKAM